jgi:Domain of unknown function (DU1801)
MAEIETKPTEKSVKAFLDGISDKSRRTDCYTVLDMMKRVTGDKPTIWGTGVVGFGSYHYKYASGHEGDCFLVGFASRKSALTLYITAGVERFPKVVEKLGKHKAGKGCLYIKKLDDVNLSVLEDLLKKSVEHTKATYKPS